MNIKYAVNDTLVMTNRVLKQVIRSVDTIITVLIMPIMMLLAFTFVFGGAMNLGGVSSVDYMMPGVILMCVLSGVSYTAYRLKVDVQKGIFERFHSMPIAKSSILGGHVVVSVISNIASVVAIVLVGLLVGFRPHANLIDWLCVLVVILFFTFAMTLISVFFGLIAKSIETVGIFSYILIGLTFTSSSFAPVNSMPAALGAFAEHQPMTPIADSLRLLLLDQPTGTTVWVAVAWCVGIVAVFWALSVLAYKSHSTVPVG
jgi:ABC-2 type transport system permease protein